MDNLHTSHKTGENTYFSSCKHHCVLYGEFSEDHKPVAEKKHRIVLHEAHTMQIARDGSCAGLHSFLPSRKTSILSDWTSPLRTGSFPAPQKRSHGPPRSQGSRSGLRTPDSRCIEGPRNTRRCHERLLSGTNFSFLELRDSQRSILLVAKRINPKPNVNHGRAQARNHVLIALSEYKHTHIHYSLHTPVYHSLRMERTETRTRTSIEHEIIPVFRETD